SVFSNFKSVTFFIFCLTRFGFSTSIKCSTPLCLSLSESSSSPSSLDSSSEDESSRFLAIGSFFGGAAAGPAAPVPSEAVRAPGPDILNAVVYEDKDMT
uniref:Uncharacterized protein n=1 Tax=Romanomermis culicivorax TaxID=13658 RepID=A0A915IJS5_ROMCU